MVHVHVGCTAILALAVSCLAQQRAIGLHLCLQWPMGPRWYGIHWHSCRIHGNWVDIAFGKGIGTAGTSGSNIKDGKDATPRDYPEKQRSEAIELTSFSKKRRD